MSRKIDRAERRYRWLLLLYPRDFRKRFAGDQVELFRDLYQANAAQAGRLQRLGFWLHIVRDTVVQGVQEQAMSLIVEDVRHAVRAVRSQPGLASIVVITLALAIGANSAIFTVVNAVLLRPLPYDAPERVVMLREVDPSGRDNLVSLGSLQEWQRSLKSITGISLVAGQTANLTGIAEPDRLRAGFVTSGFFSLLGVEPIVGRGFRTGEDQPGAAKTAVLTYATWQRRFGGDPGILGRSLMLNNEPHEVIGVLPARFEYPIDEIEVWMPLTSYPGFSPSLRARSYLSLGRVAPGVSFDEAAAELRAVAAGLAQAQPESAGWSARLEPFHEVVVGFVNRNLRLLMGAVGFVLLIACANIANLLLVRATARQREMAVRTALGASRGRLARQLLIESLLMAVAGGTLGLLLGGVLTERMLALGPVLPRVDRVQPDITVLLFTAALSIATGILFGVLPALRTSRTDVRAGLSEGARAGEGRATSRLRATLVVAELALSLVLLIGAGLMIQSLYRVLTVDKGFNAERVLTLEYRLPRNKYQNAKQQWEFHRRALEQIAAVPGVETAALASAAPQSGNGAFIGYWKSEEAEPPRENMPRAQYTSVSPEFFRVLEVPIVAGRVCRDSDAAETPLVAIVNRHLAERLWPGESAVGRQLRSPDIPIPVTVAGVVGNTRPRMLSMPVTAQIYGCLSQNPGVFSTVIARTHGEPMAVARSVQQAIWSVDPDQPMWKIRSGETLVAGSVQTERFVMVLMVAAALLAVLLAGLGTYTVLSHSVQRRSRELGVRMALGATRFDVARLILSQTTLLVLIGVAAGVAGALALSRLVATQLFEVSPRDPLTFAATSALLAGVALFAAWLPARRATSVDPMITLRAE
jgi:putative ABC transport system permease protein